MNSTKTLYSIFGVMLLVMVSIFAMAVSSNTYQSSEIHDVTKAEVIIYGTPQCHFCKKTRKLLSAHNIPFFEYDISVDRNAYQTFQRLQGRGTPLVVIGDQVIKGFNEPLIRELLNITDEPEDV
ncbi:MAG: glutaredoxin family protein [Saccharospirillaceae bacterium]|nr:glutaredoxin family protein [Pseudomonadales bacterium]NRB80465.1 glutaredoxin family protein [Saccharospirillaceae bacterium]